MNIAGVLVHAHPDRQGAVGDLLAALPGVEVHKSAPGGRLIVTVEDVPEARAADTLLAVHRLPGVVSAALVYHHFEPDAADIEERNDAAVTA